MPKKRKQKDDDDDVYEVEDIVADAYDKKVIDSTIKRILYCNVRMLVAYIKHELFNVHQLRS